MNKKSIVYAALFCATFGLYHQGTCADINTATLFQNASATENFIKNTWNAELAANPTLNDNIKKSLFCFFKIGEIMHLDQLDKENKLISTARVILFSPSLKLVTIQQSILKKLWLKHEAVFDKILSFLSPKTDTRKLLENNRQLIFKLLQETLQRHKII